MGELKNTLACFFSIGYDILLITADRGFLMASLGKGSRREGRLLYDKRKG